MTGGTLVVTRSSELRDLLRTYRVLLDGVEVGALRRGKSIALPVAEGPHELQVRIDWTGSPPVRFEVTVGSCTRFVVTSSKKAGAAGLAPEDWLTITPEQG